MAAVACALMIGAPAPVVSLERGPTQVINDALRAGRIDAQVVTDLRTGGVTVALAYVAPPTRSAAVSGPDPDSHAPSPAGTPAREAAPPVFTESDTAVAANRAELQQSKGDVVANTTRSRVVRAYADLPVQQVEIRSEADLVRILTAPTTVFVGADVVFRPALTQALGLIHQVPLRAPTAS